MRSYAVSPEMRLDCAEECVGGITGTVSRKRWCWFRFELGFLDSACFRKYCYLKIINLLIFPSLQSNTGKPAAQGKMSLFQLTASMIRGIENGHPTMYRTHHHTAGIWEEKRKRGNKRRENERRGAVPRLQPIVHSWLPVTHFLESSLTSIFKTF